MKSVSSRISNLFELSRAIKYRQFLKKCFGKCDFVV